MSGTLRQMVTCHWAARRIQRYVDADPAALLTPGEVVRLEAHLTTCEECSELVQEHRTLHRALSLWSGRRPVDPEAVDRMRRLLDDLTDGSRS